MTQPITIPVGDFYTGEPYRDVEKARPTAERLLRDLTVISTEPVVAEASYEAERWAFKSLGQVRYRTLGGEVPFEDALHALSSALGFKGPVWFDKYATDPNVTSDGTAIRWQDVKIYEDSEGRSRFDGLWLWEVRRIGDARYRLFIQRIG